MNRASIANIQAADRVLRDSPVSEDPVTGVPVIPSVNDISQQLKDSPEKDVARRPAVPVELLLLSPEEAEAASGTMLIFIDVQQQVVLGGFSLSTQIGGPSGEPSRSTILELAPPAPGSDVAVVRRPETGWAASCGIADAAETVMLIPYDDIAGKTRISVSLTDLTYRPVTEFDTPF